MKTHSHTLIGDRARVFAHGLYHIASCDGFHERERLALEQFISQVNLSVSLDELAEHPFDYGRAAVLLDSVWLRRTFVQACRIMVQMDGRISLVERDALRSMASALGIGEAFALEGLDGYPDPSELVRWVDTLEVDFVAWDDITQPAYLWFFPHPAHPIAHGATIHIYEGQALAVSHEGIVTDLLAPGAYQATPEDLPGFARAAHWDSGSAKMNLLFVRTGPSGNLRWGMSKGVTVNTASHGKFLVRAYGRFSVSFDDLSSVIHRFARTSVPEDRQLEQRFGRIVAGRFGEAIERLSVDNPQSMDAILCDLDLLRDSVAPLIRAALKASGLRLLRFQIENLTVPLETGIKPISTRTQSIVRVSPTTAPNSASETTENAIIFASETLDSPGASSSCERCGVVRHIHCPVCGHLYDEAKLACPKCTAVERT
ncbi:MAG: SPFH domain-containing protein [Myxococcota bacterium]|nr:SPFH domain-containing protein [Myxococcota bacterium]